MRKKITVRRVEITIKEGEVPSSEADGAGMRKRGHLPEKVDDGALAFG